MTAVNIPESKSAITAALVARWAMAETEHMTMHHWRGTGMIQYMMKVMKMKYQAVWRPPVFMLTYRTV